MATNHFRLSRMIMMKVNIRYYKVATSNTSHLEAHAGSFRLLMTGAIDPYLLLLFDNQLIL